MTTPDYLGVLFTALWLVVAVLGYWGLVVNPRGGKI